MLMRLCALDLEQSVDEALDSLVSTAHKIDLTFRKPTKG